MVLHLLPKRTRDQNGFTLVELLFATFILAIVISAVYGAYRATFHVIHTAEKQLELDNSARIILDRFSDDLLSIVTGPGGMVLGETNMISGSRGDSISFVSSNHLLLSKNESNRGRALIKYHSALDEKTGTLSFLRSDTLVLPGENSEDQADTSYLVGKGLYELRITYFGPEGETSDEWNSMGDEIGGQNQEGENSKDEETPILPQRIAIELVYGDENESGKRDVFRTAVALPRITEEEQ